MSDLEHGTGVDAENDGSYAMPNATSVSLVIAGRGGVGKTALANAILKKASGEESDDISTAKSEFFDYSTNHQGVDFKICDCPGLETNFMKHEDQFLTKLKEKVDQCDVVIYCIRMDAVGLETMDMDNIDLISHNLGDDFWKKAVVALTFANFVSVSPDASKENSLIERGKKWQTELQSCFNKAGVPKDVVDKIRLLPTSYYNKATTPSSDPFDKNWLLHLMSAVNDKLGAGSLDTIMQVFAIPEESYTEAILEFFSSSEPRIKISTGVGAGIGATIGAGVGAMLSPVVAAAGGVAGAVSGATLIYKSLTTVAQNKSKT